MADWPPVSIPPDEAFILVGECLEEAGFAVEVDVDNRSFHFPGHQPGAAEARRSCFESVDPSYLIPPPAFTPRQMDDLFDYVQAQRECYAGRGYPLVDLPSYDVFVSELEGRFDPAGALAELGHHPGEDDLTTCRNEDKPDWFIP